MAKTIRIGEKVRETMITKGRGVQGGSRGLLKLLGEELN